VNKAYENIKLLSEKTRHPIPVHKELSCEPFSKRYSSTKSKTDRKSAEISADFEWGVLKLAQGRTRFNDNES